MIGQWRFRLFAVYACVVLVQAGLAKAEPISPDPHRWVWLKDTVWYVPADGLPALAMDPSSGRRIPLFDQTVYAIQGYRYGYFWGVTRTQFWPPQSDPVPPATPPTCLRLLGSVTPEGAITLSFTPLDDSGDETTGVGVMRRHDGAWTMENQMISTATVPTGSGERRLQIAHWAYMSACPSTGACPLPGITADAQQFIAQCY
jgi:hypothetical protein